LHLKSYLEKALENKIEKKTMKKKRRKEKGASLIPAQPSKAAAQVHPRTRTLSPAFGP